MTPAEIRAFAGRCYERRNQGLMISPMAVPIIVQALRLLADQRDQDKRKRKRLTPQEGATSPR